MPFILIAIVASAAVAVIVFDGATILPITKTTTNNPSTPIILYSADAYVAEATALEKAFTNSTGIPMAPPKAGGSLLLAQEIALGDPADAFISVARSAVQPAYLKNESAGWAITFATDQMAIGYSNATLLNDAATKLIEAYNVAVTNNSTVSWKQFYTELTSGEVKVGIANPNSDPAGFRGWLTLQAAGEEYANNASYFVGRMLHNAGNVTSLSAADLIAPLQSGQLQFLFIYKSATLAQHLNLLQLPNGVNFGNVSYSSYYSRFSYTISNGVQRGGPISLWITIPKSSTNYAQALNFVAYVVDHSNSLLPKYGLSNISPPILYNDSSIPVPLAQLITEGTLQWSGQL